MSCPHWWPGTSHILQLSQWTREGLTQRPHVSQCIYVLPSWNMSHVMTKLAASWQNQQNECAPREDSDQPVHPPSLIRVFSVCSMGSWGPKLSSCIQQRLWSDWVDAQADLGLRLAHMPLCWFSHEVAQICLCYMRTTKMLINQEINAVWCVCLDSVINIYKNCIQNSKT